VENRDALSTWGGWNFCGQKVLAFHAILPGAAEKREGKKNKLLQRRHIAFVPWGGSGSSPHSGRRRRGMKSLGPREKKKKKKGTQLPWGA